MRMETVNLAEFTIQFKTPCIRNVNAIFQCTRRHIRHKLSPHVRTKRPNGTLPASRRTTRSSLKRYCHETSETRLHLHRHPAPGGCRPLVCFCHHQSDGLNRNAGLTRRHSRPHPFQTTGKFSWQVSQHRASVVLLEASDSAPHSPFSSCNLNRITLLPGRCQSVMKYPIKM